MESTTWVGNGLTQEDFMKIDLCITVDENDKVLGYGSKYECHQFLPHQPRGKLHRAFSVFLFNSEGKLLLQQRASSKITFPRVWTNTCCSHQLIRLKRKSGSDKETEIDEQESEVDYEESIASARVLGAKRAAVRKLWHELGIPAEQIPIEKFKFLTRLHYWAGDWDNYGPDTEWGEHEMDYILFIQADVTLNPNLDEAEDVRYVTLEELKNMMKPDSGLEWSPWFRIIVDRFLCVWWKDLQLTLTTDTHVDTKSIFHFDPLFIPDVVKAKLAETAPSSQNNQKPNLSTPVVSTKDQYESRKQGAYGKIETHKDSKIRQLCHFYEIVPMLYLKIRGFGKPLTEGTDEERFCDDIMTRVSRSFAAVTQHLPAQLRMAVTIFYLVLRGLDTVEDDMEAFSDSQIKIDLLKKFYVSALTNTKFSMTGVGKGDEEKLLNEFSKVVTVFQSLDPKVQAVISDVTREMGEGMSLYVNKDLGQGTLDVNEYNKYCFYVAGIIGNGLSKLFVATDLEYPIISDKTHAWYSMGLFLQKTNIIRDYLEDYVEGRTFWPQEIWKKYTTSDDLGEFAKAQDKTRALYCLNHLITDALEHVPECLAYLSRLYNPQVFLFCAIPQVMAIATLEKCFNNPKVFSGVVKIRKGTSCHIITTSSDLQQVKQWFHYFASSIASNVTPNDPNRERTLAACQTIINLTASQVGLWSAIGRFSKPGYGLFMNLLLIIFFSVLNFVVPNSSQFLSGIFSFETIIALLLVASTVSVLNRPSTPQKCTK